MFWGSRDIRRVLNAEACNDYADATHHCVIGDELLGISSNADETELTDSGTLLQIHGQEDLSRLHLSQR